MWEVAGQVLEKAGVVALLYFLTLIGGGVLFRWMAKKLAEETKARVEAEAATATKLAECKANHEAEKRAMRDTHAAEITALHEERRLAAEQFAGKLETLQERRLEEARTIVREVVDNASATRRSMDNISAVLEWLRTTMTR